MAFEPPPCSSLHCYRQSWPWARPRVSDAAHRASVRNATDLCNGSQCEAVRSGLPWLVLGTNQVFQHRLRIGDAKRDANHQGREKNWNSKTGSFFLQQFSSEQRTITDLLIYGISIVTCPIVKWQFHWWQWNELYQHKKIQFQMDNIMEHNGTIRIQ